MRALWVFLVLFLGTLASAHAATRNDAFADRERIATRFTEISSSYLSYGDTFGATIERGEPTFSIQTPGEHSLWYEFVPARTSVYLVNLALPTTVGTPGLLLEVFVGDRIGSLKRVGYGGQRLAIFSFVPVQLSAGKSYKIRVSSSGLDSKFTIMVTDTGPTGSFAYLPAAFATPYTAPMCHLSCGSLHFVANTTKSRLKLTVKNALLGIGVYGRFENLKLGESVDLPPAVWGRGDSGGWISFYSDITNPPTDPGTHRITETAKLGPFSKSLSYYIVVHSYPSSASLTLTPAKSRARIPSIGPAVVSLKVTNSGFRKAFGCRITDSWDVGTDGSYLIRYNSPKVSNSPTFEVPATGSTTLKVNIWPIFYQNAGRIYLRALCANTGMYANSEPIELYR